MKSVSKKIIFLVACFLSLVANTIFAAELYYDSPDVPIVAGSDVFLRVILDTENEDMNAVEAHIRYPKELLAFKGWKDAHSIIHFFIQKPNIEDGIISFEGIIPGGYKGKSGLLLELNFIARASGSGIISFINPTQTLLNDGAGTKAILKTNNFEIIILDKGKTQDVQPEVIQKDADPPETFKPEIAQYKELFNGKYFLVFAAEDKNSGVDHYEVREGFWGNYVIAESPYLLQNQAVDKKIFVKAVDKNGNERIEILYPAHGQAWYKNYWILGMLMIMGFIAGGIVLRKIL